jgi:nesprin-1
MHFFDVYHRQKFICCLTFQHVKQYMHAGDILRHRKDYRAGVERLQHWLRNAESILSSSQLSSTEKIKVYGEQLQVF